MDNDNTDLRLHHLTSTIRIRQATGKPLGFWLRLWIAIELVRLVGPAVVAAVVIGALIIVVLLA